ncbi:hypothetical protein NDU88_009263 [Pleurodeles waltl]|uniref:Uncharacterized protein n=1 Tax=Pleurodeles waltl TaxID=8319 RepID=A0AAV7P1X2_PLEWA|nr:hypothetical protein NDU88_009263 [Pleurodeles waltl]
MSGPGMHKKTASKEPGVSPDVLVMTILVEHTQTFNDILNAVQSIKSTLEPKDDALHIDLDHLSEDHKKLKDRVATTESTVSELHPRKTKGSLPDGARRSRAAPSKEEATKGRERPWAEVELRAGSPKPSEGRVEQQDKDPPVLDVEQIHVILGGGPLVTPQIAEDVI